MRHRIEPPHRFSPLGHSGLCCLQRRQCLLSHPFLFQKSRGIRRLLHVEKFVLLLNKLFAGLQILEHAVTAHVVLSEVELVKVVERRPEDVTMLRLGIPFVVRVVKRPALVQPIQRVMRYMLASAKILFERRIVVRKAAISQGVILLLQRELVREGDRVPRGLAHCRGMLRWKGGIEAVDRAGGKV